MLLGSPAFLEHPVLATITTSITAPNAPKPATQYSLDETIQLNADMSVRINQARRILEGKDE